MKSGIVILGAAIALAGCSTFDLALMARNSGKTGTGTAKRPGNDVTITADGTTYVGKFTYLPNGTVSSVIATSGTRTATATAVGTDGANNGTILARSADGRGIRCQFNYSGWSKNGIGICQDDTGTLYDLQISG